MNTKWNVAFEQMRIKANELGATGVMGIAKKAAGGQVDLQLRECGKEYDENCNFAAIVSGKILEMVRTGKQSGTLTPLLGEFDNFMGGVTTDNYYVAFSGASGEDDLEIAKVGLDVLVS